MRYLIIILLSVFLSTAVNAQKADTTINKNAVNQLPSLPPCEDCPGGGGDNISIENIVLTVSNQYSLLMNATILTSFAANTVFTYYWKINNGSVQSGTATKAQLTNIGLNIGSLGLTRGQTHSFRLKVDYGSVSSLWDDLATNFVYNYFDPEPTSQPTSMVIDSVKDVSMKVAWTASNPTSNGYLVLRRSGAAPTGVPTDGQSYSSGNTIGDGTVVYSGSGVSFISTGLTANTAYYYSVFSYNGTGLGTNYRTASPLTGNRTTLYSKPASQPTGPINFYSPTQNSMSLSWTAPNPAPTGYLIIRATSAVTGAPTDGVAYSAGNSIGNGTVVGTSATTSINAAGLSANTNYYYAIFAYNGSGNTTNYCSATPLTGNRTTLTTEPSNQPTGLTFGAVGGNSITLNWNAATSSPAGYLVVRYSYSLVDDPPADGQTYNPNAYITDAGYVVGSTANTSITASGLNPATMYYFAVYSYNGAGTATNYRIVSPLAGGKKTVSADPTASITGLSFSNVSKDSMRVSYTVSGSSTGYIALRKAGTSPTFALVDSVPYTLNQSLSDGSTVAYVGASLTFVNTPLAPSTKYYFRIYAYNGSGNTTNYSSSSLKDTSKSTLATPPTTVLSGPRFQNVASDSMRISFYKTSGVATGYLIVRSAGVAPTFVPVNGTPYSTNQNVTTDTIAYVGPDTTFKNSGLALSTLYHYKIYSYKGGGDSINYSASPISGNRSTTAIAPTAVLSGPRFSNLAADSIKVSFSKTSGTAAGYLIVRSKTAMASYKPVNGSSYSTGQIIAGDTVIAYSGIDTFYTNYALANATTYHFKIYAYNGTGADKIYTTSSISSYKSTLAAHPNTPTGISFGSVTSNSMSVSWSAPSPTPTGYLVIRKLGSAPTIAPKDTVTYAVNDTLSGGTVVYIGSSASFASTSLSAATTYYYAVYSYNGSAKAINYAAVSLQGNKSTYASDPASASNVQITTPATTTLTVSWTAANPVPAGYLVVRHLTALSAMPSDGVDYSVNNPIGNGTVVYKSNGTSFIATGLNPATIYYFSVFAYNGSGNATNYTSSGVSNSRTTLDLEPDDVLGEMSIQSSTETSQSINIFGTIGEKFIVLRKTGSIVTDVPADGTPYTAGQTIGGSTVVYNGVTGSFSSTPLSAGTVYFYKIFPYYGTGQNCNYSYTLVDTTSRTTLFTEPAAQPTSLTFTNVEETKASLQWQTSSASGYLILRKNNSSPTAIPTDGVEYLPNTVLGDAVVVGDTSTTNLTAAGLTPGATYYFTIFAFNGSGQGVNYRTSSPLSKSMKTVDRPNNITAQTFLRAGVTDAQIDTLSDYFISQSRAFSDGMGRLIEAVSRRASPLKKDIVSPVGYDIYGRQSKSYLGYVSANNTGMYNDTAISAQRYFYKTPPSGIAQTDSAFAATIYENSPLNRVIEQGAPGEVWQPKYTDYTGHTIKRFQRSNTLNEIRKWKADGSPDGFYGVGEIIVTETIDENNVSSWTYEDKSGKTILKKSLKASESVLTYYIYDDFGNLKYILPPECLKALGADSVWSTTTLKNKWVTQFWYDSENRLTKKKIPEADTIFTVYDPLGRMALTQDGKLRLYNNWMFTKYDALGRPILTGIYNDDAHRNLNDMQAYVNTQTAYYFERRDSAQYQTYHGYSDQAFPNLDSCQLWTVTYYDDYDFNYNGQRDSIYKYDSEFMTDTVFYRTKGKVTGTKTRVLNAETVIGGEQQIVGEGQITAMDWLMSIPYYDKFGRVIQNQSTNSLEGQDVSWTEYDFSGKVVKAKTIHRTPGQAVTVRKSFDYDHAGRLVNVYQKNNTDSQILLAQNKYNELGILIEKGLHSTNSGSTFLQKVNYSFNVRGWLTKINDPNSLGTDKFAMQLNYEQISTALTSKANYNGNISEAIWRTKVDTMHAYGYAYDDLNQLTQATYSASLGANWNVNKDRFNESASYDLNGNITSLQRRGKINWSMNTYGTMDSLLFGYIGNQIKSVNDTVRDITNNQTYDFSDYGREATFIPSDTNTYEYWYDENGNLSRNNAKGITITYNYMNMPTVVDFGGGNRIEWSYAASGSKLRKTVINGDTVVSTLDYVNGFDYRNGTLDFFYSESGRVKRLTSGSLRHEYNLGDHLGNSRVFFADTNADGSAEILQESHYYAFGMRIEGLGTKNDNKYLFNGKELTDDYGLNWYEYGWRTYDAQIGRWHQIDPLDEFHSPYCYVGNDPINWFDADGAQSDVVNPITNSNGDVTGWEVVGYRDPSWTDLLAGIGYNFGAGVGSGLSAPFDLAKIIKQGKFGEAIQNIPQNVVEGIKNIPNMSANDWARATGNVAGGSLYGGILGRGASGLSKFPLTKANGFLIGSINFSKGVPFNINTSAYLSKMAVENGIRYSTIAPSFLGNTQWFGRTFLAITPEMQSTLGPWTRTVIPAGTPFRFGLVGPQSVRNFGLGIQFFTEKGATSIKP